MKLLTKEITRQALAQYPQGAEMHNQKVVAKFFNPTGRGTWFLMNLEDESGEYAWGIVDLYEVEVGSFSVAELASVKLPFGLGIERDLSFQPMRASEVLKKLRAGEHV